MTPISQRVVWRATFAGDTQNDPRVQITECSSFDFGIFATRATVATEAYPRG